MYVKRDVLEGEVSSIDDFTIHHTAPSQSGHSGSPIVTYDDNGKIVIVGIHTHRGIRSGINSGLYFSHEILSRIQ